MAITSIASVLEEASIALLARKRAGLKSFFPAVTRANNITLGVLLLASAAKVVPERMRDPQFLTTQTAQFPGTAR